LSKRLRNLALRKYYGEADDEHAFHKLLQSLTTNAQARELIERMVTDPSLKVEVSKHYFADETHTTEVKQLLHAMSNGGAVATWRAKHLVRAAVAEHEFIGSFAEAMDQVTVELAQANNGPAGVKLIQEHFPNKRDPRLTWKSFLLQESEMLGLLVKLQTAEEWGVGIGPPLHDCLFVERSGDTRAIADAMSANILAKTGRHVTVAVKRVEAPPEAEDPAVFKLKTQMDFFDEKDFRHNMGMTSEEDIAASLLEYNTWLGRFFVAIVKEKDPMIAELSYKPGTGRTSSLILRSPKQTLGNYLDMDIQINTKKTMGLLAWYLKTNPARRTADRVQMWTSEEDAAAHPRDLNLFGGLKYDERFHKDQHEKTQFVDPFPRRPPLFPDANWRDAQGLDFILWHLKFVLCNADADAFAYLMQWFGNSCKSVRSLGCSFASTALRAAGSPQSLERTEAARGYSREYMLRITRRCRRSSKS